MASILKRNLTDELKRNPERRGWFIGHFMEPESVFKRDDFEVKWGVHPKGEKKSSVASNMVAKTVAILVRGKFSVTFPDEKEEIILSKEGDSVFFDSKINHFSEALEDSVVLTIRWPSKAGDQKPKDG